MIGWQNGGYKIDVVLVIDATGSMGPIINQVKEKVLTIGDTIRKRAEREYGKPVDALRIRVVDFADFATEGKDAIRASDFFELPREQAAFEAYVRSIRYESRGGDEPENALEALWVAMNSDWVALPGVTRGRHAIILITDAFPLDLGERTGCEGYDADAYPQSLQEMAEAWNGEFDSDCKPTRLSRKHKRLLLYAPEGMDSMGHSWDRVAGWAYATHFLAAPGKGLADVDLEYDVLAELFRAY